MAPSTTLSIYIDPALDAYRTSASTYISHQPSEQLVGILCAAVILHKGRVLLIQRAAGDDYPNVWEVPGGVAHDNETIIDCAVRELWEETGLRASAVTTVLGEFKYDNGLLPPSSSAKRGKWTRFISRVIVDDESLELEIKLDFKVVSSPYRVYGGVF